MLKNHFLRGYWKHPLSRKGRLLLGDVWIAWVDFRWGPRRLFSKPDGQVERRRAGRISRSRFRGYFKGVAEKGRQEVWAYRQSRLNTGGIAMSAAVSRGLVVGGSDLAAQETRGWSASSYDAIDSGLRIRLSSTIQSHLTPGDQREIYECTL